MQHEQDVTLETNYISVKEVAQYLGMKISTVYAWVPEIPHYRIGNLIRFRKEDIDNWMATKREGVNDRRAGIGTVTSAIDDDDIVRRAIDAAKAKGYNSLGKSDRSVKGLGKER